MSCANCARLERELEHLYDTLGRAVWVEEPEVFKLKVAFKITPNHARILAAVYAAGDAGLNIRQLDKLLPRTKYSHSRKDPEFRDPKTVQVDIAHLRKRLDFDPFVRAWTGCIPIQYVLTPEARAKVQEVLG